MSSHILFPHSMGRADGPTDTCLQVRALCPDVLCRHRGRPMLRFSSNPPNREFSWLSFEFWKFCPYFDSSSDSDSPRWLSSKKSSRLISGAKQSNAPAMARFSMVRRLMAPLSTRSTKSYIEVNGPPSFLAAIMALTTFPPMPFMAASPNRMSPLRVTPPYIRRDSWP